MPGYHPETVYAFAVNGLLLAAQVWVVIVANKYSYTKRLVITFVLMSLTLILVPLVANVGEGAGFWGCFSVLLGFGLVSGVCQASVFALAAGLPFKYMGAVMLGNGISGIGSNSVRALTLVIWPADEKEENQFIGALVFCILAACYMVICALAQLYLRKNEYAMYHLWDLPGF
jgi:solute carrier family 29 (equilibrative nucleoside transporter), member 1/2/3